MFPFRQLQSKWHENQWLSSLSIITHSWDGMQKNIESHTKKVIWIHQPELSNVQWWSRYSLMLTSVHVNSFTETKGRTGVSALCAWYIGNLYNLASSNYSSILLRTAGNLFLTQIVITCPHQTFGLISLIVVSSMASLTTLLCCMKEVAGRSLNVCTHFWT